MLVFITTDACIAAPMLNRALTEVSDRTFNMLTGDGDTSTNDMVCVLANGLAENTEITSDGPEYRQFVRALETVSVRLVEEIARDGEGRPRWCGSMCCTP
jgi:glutamate N-acetyltransferase/amino-acid N-acetyltransferase